MSFDLLYTFNFLYLPREKISRQSNMTKYRVTVLLTHPFRIHAKKSRVCTFLVIYNNMLLKHKKNHNMSINGENKINCKFALYLTHKDNLDKHFYINEMFIIVITIIIVTAPLLFDTDTLISYVFNLIFLYFL